MTVLSAPSETIFHIDPGYRRAKRVLDVAFTLIVLVPVCLVIAIFAVLILLDSPGPVFLRQRRVGQNGSEFDMLKLRSMHVNTNDAVHREAIQLFMNGDALNGDAPGGAAYKLSGDARITRVGRLIRKMSIDELPQFFNVLCGKMSLVGPRPPLPYEVELYSPRDWQRLSGKPGLTGDWQVYARSKVPFHTMVEMDIAYLQRQSLWHDLKLILLTVPVAFLGRGGA